MRSSRRKYKKGGVNYFENRLPQEIRDEILTYMPPKDIELTREMQSPFIRAHMQKEIRGDDLVNLKYLLSHGLISEAFTDSCSVGALKNISYLLTNYKNKISQQTIDNGFINACSHGHIEIVEFLLQNGANVHAVSYTLVGEEEDHERDEHDEAFHDQPLISASANGRVEIVKLLLKNGADIHVRNDFALLMAVQRGYFETVKYLVSQGADTNNGIRDIKSLRYAAMNGDLNMVKYLVEHGANIDDWAMDEAIEKNKVDIVDYFLERGFNINEALIIASGHGNFPLIEQFLKNGADIHWNNDEAFNDAIHQATNKDWEFLAAMFPNSYRWYKGDKLEIIRFLIEKGANVNAENGDALTTACTSGNLPLVELLLKNGANAQNKLALDAARENNNTNILELLQKYATQKIGGKRKKKCNRRSSRKYSRRSAFLRRTGQGGV